jgi:hypothetical protein
MTVRKTVLFDLPNALAHLRSSIDASQKILDLPANWDDAGAKEIEETTWRRAVDFLAHNARYIWDRYGLAIATPDITPAPNGSVDLHWDRPEFELLINLPSDPSAPAGFYGDDRGEVVIEGRFNPNRRNEGLILWLTKQA